MNDNINNIFPINDVTSLYTLKNRWKKTNSKVILHVLNESGIFPFIKDEWVTTPYENIKELCKLHKYVDEGYEFTSFETTLKDNAIFTEIDKKQYVSCSICAPVELDPFVFSGMGSGKTTPNRRFDCSYKRSKGGVVDADTVLINPAEGDFYPQADREEKEIFFDGIDLKWYEQTTFGVDHGLEQRKPEQGDAERLAEREDLKAENTSLKTKLESSPSNAALKVIGLFMHHLEETKPNIYSNNGKPNKVQIRDFLLTLAGKKNIKEYGLVKADENILTMALKYLENQKI